MVNHVTKLNVEYSRAQGIKSTGLSSFLNLWQDRVLFFSLCFYLLSQGFMIPIRAIGPSWAVWPTFSDIAALMLFLVSLLKVSSHTRVMSAPNKVILRNLLVIFSGSTISYVLFIVLFPSWSNGLTADNAGATFGAFQLYRLVQFIIVFWVTALIPITDDRLVVLRRIADAVLIFVITGVVLTYLDIVPKGILVAHLPSGLDVAGPWAFYTTNFAGSGWGTIGYNHAYVAAQILMLVGLRICLSLDQKIITNGMLLLVSMFAIFISGSRAGLAAALVLMIAALSKKPAYALVVLIIGVILGAIIISTASGSSIGGSEDILSMTTERQFMLTNAYDAESLNGRDEIWSHYLSTLREEPSRWLVGSGFGSASGKNAHMLYLQIIFETGLIGLAVFVLVMYKILSYLRFHEKGIKPIFWLTIALLVSAITQETFYPVPSLGHFLGLYLCTIAIALRSDNSKSPEVRMKDAKGVREGTDNYYSTYSASKLG